MFSDKQPVLKTNSKRQVFEGKQFHLMPSHKEVLKVIVFGTKIIKIRGRHITIPGIKQTLWKYD